MFDYKIAEWRHDMDVSKEKARKSSDIAKEVDNIAKLVENLDIGYNPTKDGDIEMAELEIDMVLKGMDFMEDMDVDTAYTGVLDISMEEENLDILLEELKNNRVEIKKTAGSVKVLMDCVPEEEGMMVGALEDSARNITTTTFNIDEQARGKKRKRHSKDKVYNWTSRLCPGSRREAVTYFMICGRYMCDRNYIGRIYSCRQRMCSRKEYYEE